MDSNLNNSPNNDSNPKKNDPMWVHVDRLLLSVDCIQVNRSFGIIIFKHLKGEASKIKERDVEVVLLRLSVLEAIGKFRVIRSSMMDVVLERV